MKIAVVQHRLRETPEADAAALLDAARAAAEAGAEFVVMPEVPSLGDTYSAVRESMYAALDDVEGMRLIPHVGPGHEGVAFVTDPLAGAEGLGSISLTVGDACFKGSAWIEAMGKPAMVAVMCPRSENDLQAEAAMEVALALSDSLAGLVIIAETAGAEVGEPGHGGSAIIALGKVVAEAMDSDELLLADVALPVAQPEPREPLPAIPTILQQRLAHHAGHKLDMGYLADLSDGLGAS